MTGPSSNQASRSLALIKKSGSTSRILNLNLVHERFGETDDYKSAPFFNSRKLNMAILLKHSLRGAENYLFEAPRPSATKILLPLDSRELAIGGTNIFVGQKNFEGALRTLCAYADDAEMYKDIELLECLDKLPSLDPFLLREQVKHLNRNPARCYFQISDHDLRNMQDFVSEQVFQLIDMAFSGRSNKDVSRQMATKILADENADTLAPLKMALGLDGQEWSDGVFAWKGFLYYKWSFANLIPQTNKLITGMKNIGLGRCDPASAATVRQMMARARELLRDKVQDINRLLKIYDSAYNTLTVEKKPGPFKDFLLKSPEMFVQIGAASGVVGHLIGFWNYKFKGAACQLLSAAELADVFQEFENCRVAEGGAQATESVWTTT
jgi:hypothetical protein